MAIYHLCAHAPIARSAGRSATRAIAYRHAARIVDQQTGEIHDYRRKLGVIDSRLILPGDAPSPDRSEFWNSIERHHKRQDAVIAREVVVALPHELGLAERAALAYALAEEIADRFTVAVDVALHAPARMGSSNWHAHLLMTACVVLPDGRLGKKCNLLDPIHCSRHRIPDSIAWMRPRWCDLVNEALSAAGSSARVDHRSHDARGLDTEPTEHEGPVCGRAMERRIRNEGRRQRNKLRDDLNRALGALLTERRRLGAKTGGFEAMAMASKMARRRGQPGEEIQIPLMLCPAPRDGSVGGSADVEPHAEPEVDAADSLEYDVIRRQSASSSEGPQRGDNPTNTKVAPKRAVLGMR